jgi:riboflavin kinase/FMN adenylyltransferase
VANVGVRPTFGGKEDVVVEVHVLDFEEDLYGRVIDVAFVDRIRNEKRFHGIDDLVDQINLDIATARSMLDRSIAE